MRLRVPCRLGVLLAYLLSAVVAEKLETMIAQGSLNTRMKDIYDIWFILSRFRIPVSELAAAVAATFGQRKTELPTEPSIFSARYGESDDAIRLWSGFLRRGRLEPLDLGTVLATIRARLEPLYGRPRNAAP